MTRTPYCPLHKTLEGKHLEGKLSRRGIFGGEFSKGSFREGNFRRGIFRGEFSEGNFQRGIFGGEHGQSDGYWLFIIIRCKCVKFYG
jgi:hypothetical protein